MEKDNEIIAKFMGLEWNAYEQLKRQYHCSWNELMPVVEKIAELDNVYKIEIYPTVGCSIYSEETFEAFGHGIEPTYKTVVDLIKWLYRV